MTQKTEIARFKRHKTLKEIKQQCREQGLEINDRLYKAGSDYIVVRGGGCRVTYSCVTGWFFGRTPDGINFNSDSTLHENESWFKALLAFFYTN